MGKECDVFQEEYPVKSTTDIVSKPPEIRKEKQEQNQTVTGQVGYYDRLKPYRYSIRAKVIK